MKFNLKQLETFIWVADLGSFRQAALRLHTTQPNISARIASLETTLGVTLMERDAGSVRLTQRGSELLQYARKVLNAIDEFTEAADNPSLFGGVLRLGVTEMIVHSWLSEFLVEFKHQFPNTDVELKVDLSQNLENDLLNHAIDLAFQSGPFAVQSSGQLELGEFPMIWVASPDIAKSMPKKIATEDLLSYSIFTHARNTRPYEELLSYFSQWQRRGLRLVPSSSLAPCVQMVIDGLGVAPLSLPLVEKQLAQGKLESFDYSWAPSNLAFYARYDKRIANHVVGQAAELAARIALPYCEGLHST